MKKGSKFIFINFAIIIFLFLSTQNATAQQCSITQNCAGGDILLKLSSQSNSHGYSASESSTIAPYSLCCTGGTSDLSCTSGKTEVIRFSAISNAHAESPGGTLYSIPICYDGFSSCVVSTTTCSTGFEEIVTLSSSTNAHIGSPGTYNTKICCSQTIVLPPSATPDAYFTSDSSGNTKINSAFWNQTPFSVYLVYENSSQTNPADLYFEVWERDSVQDESIETITAVSQSGTKMIADWQIDQSDVTAASDESGEPPLDFYFKVFNVSNPNTPLLDTKQDEELLLSIQSTGCPPFIFSCGGYTNQNDCQACSSNALDAPCSWDSTNNQCAPVTNGQCLHTNIQYVKTCTNDGELEYNYQGTWIGNPPPDPQCTGGTFGPILCPAYTQLPLENFLGIIITIIIIIAVYAIWFRKKK